MRRFAQYSLIATVSAVLLSSCASQRMSIETENGKYAFQVGEFKTAFHQLLPVAVNGHRPEAEYAVGYMYYYGLGVTQDQESGIFWMESAAQQNYQPAQQALDLIHHTPVEKRALPDRRITFHREAASNDDPVLQTLPKDPLSNAHDIQTASADEDDNMVAQPSVQKPRPAAPIKIVPVKKVAEQQVVKNEFTLQLFGAYHLSDVKSVQMQLGVKKTSRIWHTQHNGKDWYVLTYGGFPTSHLAYAEKNKLNSQLGDFAPWVRNVDGLERV